MALFTIADLHLSALGNHKMDVFGSRWQDYTQKICKAWRSVVNDQDTVVIPGDVSWGMTLDEARDDFALLNSLPGKKLIGKGNHDFWWDTAKKCYRFFEENGFTTMSLLYNNAYIIEDFIVCGTRGWFLEKEQQVTVGEVDFEKISARELGRLKLSLDAARALQQNGNENKEILVFLHFPPKWKDFEFKEMLKMLAEYGITRCYFGHIHGSYNTEPTIPSGNLSARLISSDFLNFIPYKITPKENNL